MRNKNRSLRQLVTLNISCYALTSAGRAFKIKAPEREILFSNKTIARATLTENRVHISEETL